MFFEKVTELTTVVELQDVIENPLMIYEHFMNYADEVFYVLDKEKMHGIITPGDLIRAYQSGSYIGINQNYKYIDSKENVNEAKAIFEEIPQIHEIAVVKDNELIGVIKSGYRKTRDEWKIIRKSFDPWKTERENFEREEIKKILQLDCKFIIYPRLKIHEENLSEDDKIIYKQRRLLSAIEGLLLLTEKEKEKFLGTDDIEYHELMQQFVENRWVDYCNGVPVIKLQNPCEVAHIDAGYRWVPNAPKNAKKKIYTYGACMMFGAFVNDYETVQTHLQRELVKRGWTDYEVINSSAGGASGRMAYERVFVEPISKNDLVIIMTDYFQLWKLFENEFPDKIRCMETLSNIFDDFENPLDYMLDDAMHCNNQVNELVAERMFKDIQDLLNQNVEVGQRKSVQNYYISWDIVEYYKRHFAKYKMKKSEFGKNGAIVMNCNPFTKGHRYLIEEAAKRVDNLYIFVVEENKSSFMFYDRFRMVKIGTSDLKNVYVIPSGKYIISSKTFEQYFRKDQVNIVEDMDYDVHIFGEVVAKELSIAYRFVGEEPYDKVTAKYNETMKRILPEYGIEVIELPRKADFTGEIISASKVRNYILENNCEKLKDMLDENIVKYLEENVISLT